MKPSVATCTYISKSGGPRERIGFSVIFIANIKFSGHNFWKKYLMKVLFKFFFENLKMNFKRIGMLLFEVAVRIYWKFLSFF